MLLSFRKSISFVSAILPILYRLSFWNKMNLISAFHKQRPFGSSILPWYNPGRDRPGTIFKILSCFEDLVFCKHSAIQSWRKCTYLLPVYCSSASHQALTLRMALRQSVTQPVLNEQHTRHRLHLSNKPNLTYVVPSRPFGKCRLIDLVLCLAYELLQPVQWLALSTSPTLLPPTT